MPSSINTPTVNASQFYLDGFMKNGVVQRVREALGVDKATFPDRTRDMIKELTPNFVRNWRNKFANVFTGNKIEK